MEASLYLPADLDFSFSYQSYALLRFSTDGSEMMSVRFLVGRLEKLHDQVFEGNLKSLVSGRFQNYAVPYHDVVALDVSNQMFISGSLMRAVALLCFISVSCKCKQFIVINYING